MPAITDLAKMRTLVDDARVARLATVRPDGSPHIVPICFATAAETIYSGADQKPKGSMSLRRFANIASNPHVSLLVDHYQEDWTKVWWVRLDGVAREVIDPEERAEALLLLTIKYKQYETEPITGPVMAIAIERWSGWSYSDSMPD